MRAHLIDLSKWNAAWDPSLAEVDVDGVILRASYGLVPDRLFPSFYSASLMIPVRGAYHYFSSGSSWFEQAKFFSDQVDGKEIHFAALDFERGYNQMSAEFALEAGKWMDEVQRRTQLKMLLYTNTSTYDEWLAPFADWMDRWPLWLAQYPYRAWNSYLEGICEDLAIHPRLPEVRRDWALWQYSADGNHQGVRYGVRSRDVDLNVFNGSAADLQSWGITDEREVEHAGACAEAIKILDELQAVVDRHRWR